MLFTAADTAHLLLLTGALSLPDDPARITALTSGIPALVRAAVAAITNLPDDGDRARLLDQCVDQAIDEYTADHVLTPADALGQRDFVLHTAYARALTTDLAQLLYNSQSEEPETPDPCATGPARIRRHTRTDRSRTRGNLGTTTADPALDPAATHRRGR